jgi:colicin import membrane protein
MKQEIYNKPLIFAIVLHVVILAFLLISFRWNSSKQQAVAQTNVVNAITIDAKQLQSQITKRELVEEEKHHVAPPAKVPPVAEDVKNPPPPAAAAPVSKGGDEKAEIKKQQLEEKKQLEAQKQAVEQAKKLAALQHEKELEKKRIEKHKLEEQKQLELAAKKNAEAEHKKLLAEKKLQEAKREKAEKQKLEKSLQQQLAKEAKHDLEKSLQKQLNDEETKLSSSKTSQAELSEIDKYKTQILQAIAQRWLVPDDVDHGLSCKLNIRLAPSGAVLNVTLAKSSGDSALDRSAIAAVYKASPLPVPDTALFEKFRELSLTVRPEGVI